MIISKAEIGENIAVYVHALVLPSKNYGRQCCRVQLG